ncbi:hypothetical protein [Spongiactinospora sp. 9N601]|uniref:hypothetical protein n=1 Tax=Spongiactinospora sp. 9N601 TaxID=3375149 RepID=UPI0037A1A80D
MPMTIPLRRAAATLAITGGILATTAIPAIPAMAAAPAHPDTPAPARPPAATHPAPPKAPAQDLAPAPAEPPAPPLLLTPDGTLIINPRYAGAIGEHACPPGTVRLGDGCAPIANV